MTSAAPFFDATALHIVKDEIDASLKHVEMVINHYIEARDNSQNLLEAIPYMQQVHGVLQLIEISGAIELAGAMSQLMMHIASQLPSISEDQLIAMSDGIIYLTRYLEFVLLRNSILPDFLLPTINQIHQLINQPMLREGYFISPYLSVIQLPPLTEPINSIKLQPEQIEQLIATYRQILNQLLKQKTEPKNFQILITIGQYAQQHTVGTTAAFYWQLVQHAFVQLPQSILTDSRLRVLIQIEKHLHLLLNHQFTPTPADLADVICLCTTSTHPDASILCEQLGLSELIINDTQREVALHDLQGPDSDTIHTTTALMQAEIQDIKNDIDSLQHGDQSTMSLPMIADKIDALAKAMALLNLNEASNLLLQQALQIQQTISLTDANQMNPLMDALLIAGNYLAMLNQHYEAQGGQLPFNNPTISQYQLYEAMQVVIRESRETLSDCMQNVDQYLLDQDPTHLSVVAEQLEHIGGVLVFLNAKVGQEILNKTANYLRKLIESAMTPDQHSFELLANIMMCVDHYLEGLALQKPVGIRPFDVGLNSIQQLQAA